MASLASSAVSLYPSVANGGLTLAEVAFGGTNNKARLTRSLLLVLTGQGGQTNTITATALGFSKLLWASTLWDATNAKGYDATIDPVNNLLILLDGSAAPAPVDVTTTAGYITVTGIPFVAATAPV